MARAQVRCRRSMIAFGLAATFASLATGCVERRYTIRTDPPGALVYVNGEEIGASPVSRSFTYYGAREIVLIAPDGTQKKIIQEVNAPLYDNALTDFFTENFLPVTLRDEREFFYTIEPNPPTDTNTLLQQGQALRQQGSFAPPPRPKGIFTRIKEFFLGPK